MDLASAQHVQQSFGRYDLVRLHGLLEVPQGGPTTVLGVDVRADPAWRGQAVVATGGLERWENSERFLRLGLADVAPFKQRGAAPTTASSTPRRASPWRSEGAVATPEAGRQAPK